jgi:two-component system, NarL family, sensor histidine kinase UhpB
VPKKKTVSRSAASKQGERSDTVEPSAGARSADPLASINATLRVELAARERELSAIYTNVPGILFYIAVEPDGDFRFLAMSDGGLAVMGLSRKQVVGSRVAAVIPPPSRDMVLTHYREAIRLGKTVRWEEVSVYPAGRRHGEVAVTPLYDANGVPTHLIGIVHDVTEIRESHARIRELAERLAAVRENERRAVAVTLHETVAQELYAAQLSLRALERKGRGRSGITELAKGLSRVIDQSIEDVRSLTDQLYPTSLVHLPLLEALEQLAQQARKGSAVRIVVDQQRDFPPLQTQSRALFFRAAQEALANVARHAGASQVTISLEADAGRIAMVVADDGKGVAPVDLRKPGSLGLLGIRERFAAVGGGLVIERGRSRGTCLTVFLPSGPSATARAPRSAKKQVLPGHGIAPHGRR